MTEAKGATQAPVSGAWNRRRFTREGPAAEGLHRRIAPQP